MIDSNGDIIEMTVRDYIPYINIDQKKKKGTSSKISKILNIISDEYSTSEGENMMVIDGESGDELEDLTAIVRRSDSKSSRKGARSGKPKRKRARSMPEVAVGSDHGHYVEGVSRLMMMNLMTVVMSMPNSTMMNTNQALVQMPKKVSMT